MRNRGLKERIKNSILGFVLGDCLGVPYEFKTAGTVKFKPFEGHGTHYQPAGTWSDDTSLTLAMMDSIVNSEYNGTVHREKLKEFSKGNYSVNGNLFDIGTATRMAIESNFRIDTDDSCGNGGLLRTWTLTALSCLQGYGIEKERKLMEQAISLTHSTEELYMKCCELYCELLKTLYLSENKLIDIKEKYDELSKSVQFKQFEYTEGHICNAIKFTFDVFFSQKDITNNMESFKTIIEMGGDTDSNAALLGALLGAKNGIDKKYIGKIVEINKIEDFIETFSQIDNREYHPISLRELLNNFFDK